MSLKDIKPSSYTKQEIRFFRNKRGQLQIDTVYMDGSIDSMIFHKVWTDAIEKALKGNNGKVEVVSAAVMEEILKEEE